MPLPDEDLLAISDVASHLGKSDEYVKTKLRQRKFQRVIIEYRTTSGGQWTSHYYFDKAVWPFGANTTHKDQESDLHHLLDPKEGDESWLEDAREIFTPASAVEAFVQENDNRPEQPNASSSPATGIQLDISKMSENLRIAIQADTDLYSHGGITTNRGDREQINEWLQRNHPSLTLNRRETIITVVNRRKGGAPCTGQSK